jgi:hypothetical protein
MSRSYKKYPSGKCEKSCKKGQRFANKTIRHYKECIPKGGYFRKIYNTWAICDYKYVAFTKKEQEKWTIMKRK